MGVAELKPLGDLLGVSIFASAKVSHPELGTGDGENEGVVDPPWQRILPARNDDLFAGTRRRGRQQRGQDLRCLGVFVRGGGGVRDRLHGDLNLTRLNDRDFWLL